MFRLDVPTKRGVVLNGVLFRPEEKHTADTVMIAITGIHGNFYSNPFYYNIGDTLNNGGIDFIYAQTNDAFGQIKTINVNTGKEEMIGSWNERFSYTDPSLAAGRQQPPHGLSHRQHLRHRGTHRLPGLHRRRGGYLPGSLWYRTGGFLHQV